MSENPEIKLVRQVMSPHVCNFHHFYLFWSYMASFTSRCLYCCMKRWAIL